MNSLVSVIGTIFVDCKGFAANNYQPSGRNLGDVKFVHGGVGRNVAETMARLGIPLTFVSSVDKTAIGEEVVKRLNAAQIDLSNLLKCNSRGMGMWLAVLNDKGDLSGSISQMPDLKYLEDLINSKGEQIVKDSSEIVLELDLNEKITKKIITKARQFNKPVYGIPGNLDVILKNKDILGELECFICNNFEADQIFENDFSNLNKEKMIEALIHNVKSMGLRSMVVTLGDEGSVYYDSRTGENGHQAAFPVKLVDSSGAGDAFFSGTVSALINGQPLKQAVTCGTKVAAWTIESTENTCLELDSKIENENIFEKAL